MGCALTPLTCGEIEGKAVFSAIESEIPTFDFEASTVSFCQVKEICYSVFCCFCCHTRILKKETANEAVLVCIDMIHEFSLAFDSSAILPTSM